MASGNKNFKTVMVPSENGWGYMICVGFTLTFTVCMCHSNSFGLMFNDFLKENNDSSSVLTSVYGVTGITISLAGLIVNFAQKYFSIRQIAIFGAICYSLCWLLNTFITSVFQMLFTNGILNGFGWGILMSTGYTTFNSYFVEKRVMMMGICMSVVGFGSILFPFFVEYTLDMYGYRGMMALIGAITTNSIVGSALYQPAEWHLVPKIIYVDDEEHPEKDKTKDPINEAGVEMSIMNDNTSFKEQSIPLMTTATIDKNIPKIVIGDDDKMVVVIDGNGNNKLMKNPGILKRLAINLDLVLLKDLSFFNVNLAIGIGMFCDLQFYMLQPLLLFEYGFTTSQVASCVSITSIADLTSRVFMAIVSKFFTIRSRYLCYASISCLTVTRILFLQFNDYIGVAIMTALLGFFRGWFYIGMPLMCADVLTVEKYSAGYALAFLTTGFFNALLAPISGMLRDLTGSYVAAFYLFSYGCIIIIICWTYEFFIMKKKKYNPKKLHNKNVK